MQLDRRDFSKLLVASAVGSIAGCGGDAGSGISDEDLEGRTLTVVGQTSASRSQLNPYALRQRGVSIRDFLDQLVLPVLDPTGDPLTSGHTWNVGDVEVSVPCAVSEYQIDPPDGYTLTFDDRLTFWNGEPLDARAFEHRDRIWHLLNWKFDDERSFTGELLSDTEYRRTFPDGRNRLEIERELFPGNPPFPRTFTDPWYQQLVDASSQDAVDEVFSDLSAEDITFATFAEEGYGTGAFALESTEDIYTNSIVARARDDHPVDSSISNLLIQLAGGPESNQILASTLGSGDIDVGSAIIADEGGDLDRQSISENIAQQGLYHSPRAPGTQLLFNWGNKHIRRLWVRRALVAAIPFDEAISNVWGATRSPPVHQTGLLSSVDEATFEDDFLSALQQYPMEQDEETAGQWLERAGYHEENSTWQSPDGEALQVRMLIARGDATSNTLGQTIVNGLDAFGLTVALTNARSDGYENALQTGDYELAIGSTPGDWSPVRQYAADLSLGRGGIGGSPLSIGGNPLDTCSEESRPFSTPATVTLPDEPGAMTIEGASYDGGGATYQHDGGIDVSICEAADRLTAPDSDDDELQEAAEICARWYNYAIPNVVFAQDRIGLIGNVEEFTFPAAESPATKAMRSWTTNPAHYHVQAGIIR